MADVVDLPLTSIIITDRYRTDLGDLDGLVQSIKDKGILQPVTVDQDYKLLAGERRCRAAALADLTEVPAIIRKVVGDVDRLEIELIENIYRKDLNWLERARLEKAIYDRKGTLRSAAEALDVSHRLVYMHVELANATDAMPQLAECKTASEAWKTLQKMKEKLVVAEITRKAAEKAASDPEFDSENPYFRRAHFNYMIGDALVGLKVRPSGVFGFAEVDPPYGIDLDKMKKGKEDQNSTIQHYTEVAKGEYGQFLKDVATEVYRVLQPNSFCAWWFGISNYSLVLDTLRGVGFSVNDVPAIWYKGDQGQTNQPDVLLANCYESFFVARKGMPVLRTPGRSNVFQCTPVAGHKKIHATERPLDLMKSILMTFASPGQHVVIPFMGSGVTLLAAYYLDMTGFGWDLDEGVKNSFLLRVHQEFGGTGPEPKELEGYGAEGIWKSEE